MHYYQFNIGDYRRDTQHLSMLEHGAYRQLLDWLYLDETPIPRETEVVFRRLCARTKDEQNAVEIVLKELFELTENGYIQGKCMSVIAEYQCKSSRARDNGKLGGRPKKTKVVISGNPEETQTKANSLTQEPINPLTQELSNQELKTGKSKDLSTPSAQTTKKGTQLPADWKLSKEWGEWALTEKPAWTADDVRRVAEDFKDHWLANANQAKSKKADWFATWRKWVRSPLNEIKSKSASRQPENFSGKNYGIGVTAL